MKRLWGGRRARLQSLRTDPDTGNNSGFACYRGRFLPLHPHRKVLGFSYCTRRIFGGEGQHGAARFHRCYWGAAAAWPPMARARPLMPVIGFLNVAFVGDVE